MISNSGRFRYTYKATVEMSWERFLSEPSSNRGLEFILSDGVETEGRVVQNKGR